MKDNYKGTEVCQVNEEDEEIQGNHENANETELEDSEE